MTSELVVPPNTIRWLAQAPGDRPVMVLLRHSARPPIPPGETGNHLSITDEGVRLAEELGAHLGSRLVGIRTSPVKRCIQTAASLVRGAGRVLEAPTDRLLGEPGPYVNEPDRAWERTWKRLPYEEILNGVVDGRVDLEGFAVPRRAAGRLFEHMTEHASQAGVHVFVTHDSVVLPTAAHLLALPLRQSNWPWYLEALVAWQDVGGWEVRYRGHAGQCRGPDEFIRDELTEDLVLKFGQETLRELLGDDFGGRLFLAGGCFKSVLAGKPPRELDIWAASDDDRRLLVDVLQRRGAVPLPGSRPFGEAFRFGEVTVDIPRKTEPATLEGRLARFDLGLSCIGVELDAGRTRAVVHPKAIESARRRRVLFQKPLANWKYALYSLERARRYAVELGYALDAEEEHVVWEVFDAQDAATRQGMVDRYWACTTGRFGVPEEISCRHP